jgi:predicted PurR-regulated permease PerM
MAKFNNTEDNTGLIKLAKVTLWTILIVGSVLILKFFGNLIKPLVVALIIWYLIRILRNVFYGIRIGRFRLPRWFRTLLSLIIILGILYSIISIIVLNIEQIVNRVEQYEARQDSILETTAQYLGLAHLADELKDLPSSKELRPYLNGLLNSLTSALGSIFIIIIYLIFILIEEFIFTRKLDIIYKNNEQFDDIKYIINTMNNSIKRYISVKSFASLLTAVLAYIALLLLGVDFPLLWAFIIFVFNFIPYVGSFIATFLPSIFAVLQTNSLSQFVWVFLSVQFCQTLVANGIEPKIMGRSLNLSPLVVLITLTVWGTIWGVLGMIISVPVTSILVIVLAQFKETRNIAIMLSETGNVENMVVPERATKDTTPAHLQFWKYWKKDS